MSLVDNTFLGSAGIQQHIVSYCAPGPGPRIIPHPFKPGTRLFVKRGNPSLADEGRTQAYLSEHARSSPTAPSAPEVYATFNDGAGNAYLVMEHIDALSFRAWIDDCTEEEKEERDLRTATAVSATAEAVAWLLASPVPEGGAIGPVGGGSIQHLFFGMREAPVAFVSAAALEEYVNQALVRRPGKPTDRVSFANEALIFSPSDISLDNFLWDPPTRRVWLVDCQHINILPESFFSFYLHNSADPVVRAVAVALDFPVSPQLGLLEAAAGIVMQIGNSAFGVDAEGNHIRRHRRVPR
ncbi:hypothetical protein B0H12DRAFT_367766 [Mycena haematopus]|nr:hypothetical protein B0H12DRAFT_367766 [Mycena haematopus]